jgi:glucosamine--fructose-6-phosphate aminotransferase (isomerizing)
LAIAQHTNDFVFLEDGDVAELTANTYKVLDANQSEVEREVTHIDIT